MKEECFKMLDERWRAVLDHPFHRYLGIRDIEATENGAVLKFTVSDQIVNVAGVLHGGAIYAVCDICAYSGVLNLLGPDQEAVTHDVHFSVLQKANAGDHVTVTSKVLKKGKSLCFIDVRAMVDGRLIATATVTKSLIKRPDRSE
jgi:uncharacterized protein (TIGR00369 family)